MTFLHNSVLKHVISKCINRHPQQKGGTDGEESFEALEKQFQLVLTELLGDKSVEKFRTEYEKITGALRKAHESEKRLMSKCRELNAEIVSNSTKVETALKLSQEDEATIRSLKKVRCTENYKHAFFRFDH